MKKIILASTSPRRKELFAKLRLPFEIQASEYEEDMTLPMPPLELVEFLSLGKAQSAAEKNPNAIVIAADTFVVFENKFLGKPKSENEAKEILRMPSGKENDIVTGVTIIDTETGKQISFHDTSKVFISDVRREKFKSNLLNFRAEELTKV